MEQDAGADDAVPIYKRDAELGDFVMSLPISSRGVSSEKLQHDILNTYFTLRMGIVFLSTMLPLILYFGGMLWGGIHSLASSMSAYYGENGGTMRDWFVGILWTVGSFLYLYKGFSELENILLNIAGGFAVVVAMIPCNCWNDGIGPENKLHSFAAVSFFGAMALVCLLCANDTITLLPEACQASYKRRYRAIGIVLLASPLAAVTSSYALGQHHQYKFFIEAFGAWTFGYYWWTKSNEFKITSAEKRAALGKLENAPARGVIDVTLQNHPGDC
jgi:hypothetical protein